MGILCLQSHKSDVAAADLGEAIHAQPRFNRETHVEPAVGPCNDKVVVGARCGAFSKVPTAGLAIEAPIDDSIRTPSERSIWAGIATVPGPARGEVVATHAADTSRAVIRKSVLIPDSESLALCECDV